jgi:uncharacterized protein
MAAAVIDRVPVCVFAKPPRPGEVKTRLDAAVGPSAAGALAAAFFHDTWARISSLEWSIPILATTDVAAPEWSGLDGAEIWPQGEGTLGDRMVRVIRRALHTHPAAIVIGADLPGLPAGCLDAARDALTRADAVLGPVPDGGFYLLGMRTCPPDVLDEVLWSRSDSLRSTIDRLQAARLSTELIPAWFDTDTPEDLQWLARLVKSGALDAPATRAALSLMPAL